MRVALERQRTAGQSGRVADPGADAASGLVPERRRSDAAGGDHGVAGGDRELAVAVDSLQEPGRRQPTADGGQRLAAPRDQSERKEIILRDGSFRGIRETRMRHSRRETREFDVHLYYTFVQPSSPRPRVDFTLDALAFFIPLEILLTTFFFIFC